MTLRDFGEEQAISKANKGDEMTQKVRVLAAKSDNPCLIPRIHEVKGNANFHEFLHALTTTCAHAHTLNKIKCSLRGDLQSTNNFPPGDLRRAFLQISQNARKRRWSRRTPWGINTRVGGRQTPNS